MKKYVVCKNCRSDISIRSWSADRAKLSREIGVTFDIVCKNCKEDHQYEVNEVSAKTNGLLNAMLLILVIMLMGMIWYYLFTNFWGRSVYMVFILPMAVATPAMIYFTYLKTQSTKARNFNRYRK